MKKDGRNGDNDLPSLSKTNEIRRALSLLSKANLRRINHEATPGYGPRIALWYECHVATIGLHRRNVMGGGDFVFNVGQMALTDYNYGMQDAGRRNDKHVTQRSEDTEEK